MRIGTVGQQDLGGREPLSSASSASAPATPANCAQAKAPVVASTQAIQPLARPPRVAEGHRHQLRCRARREHAMIGEDARREDARHRALDEAASGRADLLADRDATPTRHQPRQ